MLTRLRPLFDEFEAAVDSVNAFRDRPTGQLRITVPPPAASFVLAPLLARFVAQYPEIVLEVSADPALTDIVVSRYDAGIRLGHRVARDMIAMRVTDDLRVVVVASPDYLARHPRPAKPQDLHAHNCIRLRFPSGAFLPWRFAIGGKVVEIDVEGTLIANEAGLLVQAALGGAGVLYVLGEFAAPMIANGQLVPLLEAWMPPPHEGFFLYYPSRRQNLASLCALIDFLRTNLAAKTGSAERKQPMVSERQPRARELPGTRQ
jgi:DNA-binding transcriptional LysR family regulator